MQGLREDKLNYLPFAIALVVVGLLVVVLRSGGPSSGVATASPVESRAIRRTEALLAGIPQNGPILGEPKAPVTLQFFADLQCKESRQVMLGALPFLIRHWVRDGKLRIIYRSRKADTPGWPEFMNQQVAALVAGQQGKMWNFVDLFYREQQPEFTRYADDAFLEGIAQGAGVEMRTWAEDRESEGWAVEIESDEDLFQKKKLRIPPSFLIGPTGGEARPLLHFSLEETKVFDEAIRELL